MNSIKNILVINGPNLELLGKRNTEVYGTKSLNDINNFISQSFDNLKFDFYQSNYEGALIDKINSIDKKYQAIIINPGALGHYSYALRDSIESCSLPVIEVHMSNVMEREDFRKNLVLSDVCVKTVIGLGCNSYVKAVKFLLENY